VRAYYSKIKRFISKNIFVVAFYITFFDSLRVRNPCNGGLLVTILLP